MNPQLDRLFSRLEADRQKLMHLLDGITSEAFHRSNPGKWSIQQILAHLVASERLSIQYLKKKFQGIEELSVTGIQEDLKMWILVISQRLPLKFKAPKVVVEHTPALKNSDEISTEWNRARQELREVLEWFQDHHLNRKVYKHPVVGKLNIVQMLRFFGEHIAHHAPQIKKLLKHS